ncbi:MAG: hypothetical protein JW920_12210 [Deltaproteobacteria bacterium]|nr:hypothetical protein [Deltaproteobacteria bacterium]
MMIGKISVRKSHVKSEIHTLNENYFKTFNRGLGGPVGSIHCILRDEHLVPIQRMDTKGGLETMIETVGVEGDLTEK